MGMWDWLFGSEPSRVTRAPSRPFPTSDDLEFARANDAFYDSGREYPGSTKEVSLDDIGSTDTPVGLKILNETTQLPPVKSQELKDVLATNKLASRRSAVASLGMNNNVDRTVVGQDFRFGDAAGVTVQDEDDPLFTSFGLRGQLERKSPTTPTHEAVHRGLMKLSDYIDSDEAPDIRGLEELQDYIEGYQSQEDMVRALMYDTYENPEYEYMTDGQRQLFDNPNYQYDLRKSREMNDLAQLLAQRLIYERKKSGPW